MKRLLSIAACFALASSKPEMYREKEDFQFSRSSTDEGSKSGFYGAQRGNMGGNFERAHNMDTLAQNQMSGLVQQVQGELGDGSNTRTGSVFSSANTRGTYGQGAYDLSNLSGRNFQEGANYGDSSSHSSSSSSSQNANARYSGHASSYTRHGSSANALESDDLQRASHSRNTFDSTDADRGSSYQSRSEDSAYGQNSYDQRRSGYEQSFQANSHGSRVANTGNSRIIIRPGTSVRIPVTAQVYDDAERSSAFDQNSINIDTEASKNQNSAHTGRPYHYESSYNYRKEWEKHDSVPAAAPLSIPTANSYDDERRRDYYEQQRRANNQYESTSNSRLRDNAQFEASGSQTHEGYESRHSNVNAETSRQSHYNAGYSQHLQSAASSASNAYRDSTSHSNLESSVGNSHQGSGTVDSAPRSYQSSYSYHKAWERHGDPYTIQPASDVSDAAQTSQRLTSGSADDQSTYNSHQYGSKQYSRSHQRYSASNDGSVNCDDICAHARIGRSLVDDDQTQQVQDSSNIENQQRQNGWPARIEDVGQQSQVDWTKFDDLGQQAQSNNMYSENMGQQSLTDFGNLQNYGQQTQSGSENLENFGQQTQTDLGNLEDFGQQTQTVWSQRTQNGSAGLEDFSQHTQTDIGKLEDLGQQTQTAWGNAEDLSQQTQMGWSNAQVLDQQSQNIHDQRNQGEDKQVKNFEHVSSNTRDEQSNDEQVNNGRRQYILPESWYNRLAEKNYRNEQNSYNSRSQTQEAQNSYSNLQNFNLQNTNVQSNVALDSLWNKIDRLEKTNTQIAHDIKNTTDTDQNLYDNSAMFQRVDKEQKVVTNEKDKNINSAQAFNGKENVDTNDYSVRPIDSGRGDIASDDISIEGDTYSVRPIDSGRGDIASDDHSIARDTIIDTNRRVTNKPEVLIMNPYSTAGKPYKTPEEFETFSLTKDSDDSLSKNSSLHIENKPEHSILPTTFISTTIKSIELNDNDNGEKQIGRTTNQHRHYNTNNNNQTFETSTSNGQFLRSDTRTQNVAAKNADTLEQSVQEVSNKDKHFEQFEDMGQEVENLEQQNQMLWNDYSKGVNVEDLGQQVVQTGWSQNEDLGQQTQTVWSSNENLQQQSNLNREFVTVGRTDTNDKPGMNSYNDNMKMYQTEDHSMNSNFEAVSNKEQSANLDSPRSNEQNTNVKPNEGAIVNSDIITEKPGFWRSVGNKVSSWFS